MNNTKVGKYLGEGFYYKVYELDENRVFKRLQPYWFSFKKIYAYKRRAGDSFSSSIIGAHRSRKKEELALQTIKQKLSKVPGSLFANPIFESGLNYSQDIAKVVADAFGQNSDSANEDIINQYIEFQKTLWSYGMHDTTFKLQPNYGIDKNGKLVCIDFGEFVYTKEAALKSVNGKRWTKRGSYKNWPDSHIKDYYTRMMDENINEFNLNKYWNTKNSL